MKPVFIFGIHKGKLKHYSDYEKIENDENKPESQLIVMKLQVQLFLSLKDNVLDRMLILIEIPIIKQWRLISFT